MSKGILLVALLSASACTNSAPQQASEQLPSDTLRPAPRDCPLPLIRAGSIGRAELQERMEGHLPAWLPENFGLARAFGPGDGGWARAIWTDHDCRQIALYFWNTEANSAGEVGLGPRVGKWTLIFSEPGGCANAVLGRARCLNYRASVETGILLLQMMGIDPGIGNRIARSIPT